MKQRSGQSRPSGQLLPGRYRATCREQTLVAAAFNGHSAVWPQAHAISDGNWVRFYKGEREVFSCNSAYARAQFTCEPLQAAAPAP